MSKKIGKHTLKTLNLTLKERQLQYLSAKKREKDIVTLNDKIFGEYTVDIKNFSPKSKIPKHPKRKQYEKLEELKNQYLGKCIKKKYQITDIFIAQDRGYKNRGFLFEVIGECGHKLIASLSAFQKHRSKFICNSCSKIIHGARAIDYSGDRKKRTSTYTKWISYNNSKKSKMPIKYKNNYELFLKDAGEKPSTNYKLGWINERPVWVEKELNIEDENIRLMSMGLRQVFRRSQIYKNTLENAKVETDKGTRYKCANCGKLELKSKVQVDHIEPINPTDGSKLTRNTLIDRIWTNNVQILDKKCHLLKSQNENKIRRLNKKQKKG